MDQGRRFLKGLTNDRQGSPLHVAPCTVFGYSSGITPSMVFSSPNSVI